MLKNTAGQKWIVFAFDRTNNIPKLGDAGSITANLRIDGGAANPIDDVNPTELEGGYYVFDISQAESNGSMIVICPSSITANIQVIGVPGSVFTEGVESGVGANIWTYTLTDDVTAAPLDGAEVWVTSDIGGANIIAYTHTNAAGVASFCLDSGTVYVWRRLSGYTFTNPDVEVVP